MILKRMMEKKVKDDYYETFEKQKGNMHSKDWEKEERILEEIKEEMTGWKKKKNVIQVFFIALMSILVLQFSNAIVIHQVLYDPITSETGGEAIELFNNQNKSIDISRWIIKTKSSETDATIPSGTIL